eukprot:symbB.v1.2.028729.t1/scaffold3075.1/size64185/1
MYCIVG